MYEKTNPMKFLLVVYERIQKNLFKVIEKKEAEFLSHREASDYAFLTSQNLLGSAVGKIIESKEILTSGSIEYQGAKFKVKNVKGFEVHIFATNQQKRKEYRVEIAEVEHE